MKEFRTHVNAIRTCAAHDPKKKKENPLSLSLHHISSELYRKAFAGHAL